MTLAIRLHLFLVSGWLATVGLLIWFVSPQLPPPAVASAAFFCGGWALLWVASLAWRARRLKRQRETRQFAADYNLFAMWSQNIATVGVGLSILPWIDRSWDVVAAFYVLGTIAVELVATVRPPPAKGRGSFAPLFLSASIIAYLATQGGPLAIALIVYHAAFAGSMLVLRSILQRQSDRLFIAMTQVAAERDARNRFLASVGHDLGQPLQAARLSFDQALRAGTPEKRAGAARRAHWAFDWAETMLRSMIEHLRLESGVVEARCAPVEAGRSIAEVAELHEAAAGTVGITVHAVPSSLAAQADPDLLQRSLGNLVANAIRHSKGARVLIGARRRGARIRFWVIDDGRGIPARDAARLFDDYAQGSDHGTEIRGGFGLGLASVRRMAMLMEGEFGLDRRWTGGAAFWLDLPRV